MEDPTPNKNKIIVIAGPTAVGKTRIAVDVAEAVGGEVIGADSMQVYRGFVIGAASPTTEEMRSVPHHLVGTVDPKAAFTTWDWITEAGKIIDDLTDAGKMPVVAGGAGLYVRSLLKGLFDAPDTDPELRAELRERAAREDLYPVLVAKDPDAAAKIHPNDVYRVTRALEVIEQTGKPISIQWREWGAPERYDALKIGLDMPRKKLHDRIDARTHKMIEDGLVEETRGLMESGVTKKYRPMKHFGYRHIYSHIEGAIDIDEAVRLTQRDTRRYARRQLTWFRNEKGFEWFDPEKDREWILKLAREFSGK